MASKNSEEKGAGRKGERRVRARSLSVFPTDIAKLDKAELARLAVKPDGMASEVIAALRRHGVEAGENRKKVVEHVRSKFPKASGATIKTQVYRGIVYLRDGSRP